VARNGASPGRPPAALAPCRSDRRGRSSAAPTANPHEERHEIPKHRHFPLFLRPQYNSARRAGRNLPIALLRLCKAAGLRNRRGTVVSRNKPRRQHFSTSAEAVRLRFSVSTP
jgi:hypothetical protein